MTAGSVRTRGPRALPSSTGSAPSDGVEEVRVTEEDEYFPPPRNLRELLTAVEQVASLTLGLDPDRLPPLDDRTIGASDVLESLTAPPATGR